MRDNALKRLVVSVLRRLRILRGISFVTQIRRGQSTIRLPIVAGIEAENLGWTEHEPWLDGMLKALLSRKEGAVMDIGANIGQTLLTFMGTGSMNPYYGFEPNPLCCAYLLILLELNNLRNVTVIPAALAEHARLSKLFVGGSTDSSASAVEGFREGTDHSIFQYVPVFRGDDLVDILGISSISVLKIDVEGGELEVLRGLRGTLARFKPFILLEILPVYDETSPNGRMRRARTDSVLKLVREEGYSLARILHDGTAVPLANIETHGDLSLCDYLFTPEPLSESVKHTPMAIV